MAFDDLGPPISARGEAGGSCWYAVQRQKKAEQARLLAQFPKFRLQQAVPSSQQDVSAVPLSELSDRERGVVILDATSLAEAIRERQYSAVEVTRAFCHAAALAHQLTNCLSEIFFEDGLARAAELDKYLEDTGKVVGPLHGVPVSIKDHVCVKGLDTSSGYVGWAFKTPAAVDAVVVDILRKAGAVLYVKTANPQTLLSLETNNNVFGRTTNPFNRNLTPGGSSGGESALIAMHGSPLGLGTDIGGSIRIPAAHCGLYGLKPSNARLPHAGLVGSHDGMDAIVGSLGPIATSARDLELFCRTMSQYEPWKVEPQLLEIPWRSDVAEGINQPDKLSFAILWDDGVVAPHPPIIDALRRTEAALRAAGHDVIKWNVLEHHQYAWDLLCKLYFLDGGKEYRDTMKNAGDPMVPQTEWIMSQVPNGGKPFTIAETFQLNVARERFRKQLADHWNGTASRSSLGRTVDAVLCPVSPTLAPPHDTTRWWGYTSYWNLADYPAVVFPVGSHHARDWPQTNGSGTPRFSDAPRNPVEEFVHAQWDPKTYDNAPVCLQLVGRRLNEEKILNALRVVETALHHPTAV